jgi:hypothetical protein
MSDRGAFCYHGCSQCGVEWRHVIPVKQGNSLFLDEYFAPCPSCQPDGKPPASVRDWHEVRP